MISQRISNLINDDLEIILELNHMQTYLNAISRATSSLLIVQNEVNSKYNFARENGWNDRIAYDVGTDLSETQKITRQMYETINLIFSKKLCPYCNSLAQNYAEFKDWHASCPEWTQIQKLHVGGTMGGRINKTAVKGIEDFRKALRIYIDSTKDEVKNIRNAHNQVRDSWRDNLAKAMDGEFEEFDRILKNQLNVLENQYGYVVKKRDALIDALKRLQTNIPTGK